MTQTCYAHEPETVDTPKKGFAHWLAVVSHLDPRYGGLSTVVPQLASEVEKIGAAHLDLAGFCRPGECFVPHNSGGDNISYWPTSRTAWLWDSELRERFREMVRGADGIHVHGLWEQSTAVACRVARELGKPYILSAHGMLEPWALESKRLKKYVYAALSEKSNVKGASCLHALTRVEAMQYRRFGARGPIAVVPNGVTIPDTLSDASFFKRFPELRGKRIFLYMSRLHPKKGLDLLILAWARLEKQWPEAHLVIAGPDFEGTRAAMEKIVTDHQLDTRVTFTGMLQGDMKWSALAASECFVLPSHSEGLSMSALEAMGTGLPVIVTEPCNMPEVRQLNLGWEIKPTVNSVATSMKEALESSQSSNCEIGARGKQLIQERYGWKTVALQMSEIYRWVEGGAAPTGVEVLLHE